MKRRYVFLLLLLPLLIYSCIHDSEAGTDYSGERILTGQNLPAFSVVLTNGKTVNTETLKGRPSAIIFFHTECGDCRRELPVLENIHREYDDRINFIAISRQQPASEVEAFWYEKGLTIPVSAQTDNAIYNLFAEHTIPRVYIADEKGIVRAIFVEKIDKSQFILTLENLLKSAYLVQ